MKKSRGMITMFVTPAVAMFILVFPYPIVKTVLMGFFKIEGVAGPMPKQTFSGTDSYAKLASTTLFRISMWNLARIRSIGGIIITSLALLFAVIITSGIHFKSLFRAMIYLPNIVNAMALATIWLQYAYGPKYGLTKNLFQALGLDSLARIQWSDNDRRFIALLLAYCFDMVGCHMLIFTSGIERISDNYFEVATLNGTDKFSQFRYITLPLLRGAFRTNVTMWGVTSVGFFVWFQLFSTVTAGTQTTIPTVYLYMQIFEADNSVAERNSGVGVVVGVMLSVCVVIVF